MGFFSESKKDDTNVGEWVGWGGLTRPTVMRQRDGSYFSVIAYVPYRKGEPLSFPDFRRGWAVTNEHQHFPAKDGAPEYAMDFLVILWNPFFSMGREYAENPLDLGEGKNHVRTERCIDYFAHAVRKVQKELSRATDAWVLEYQGLMDFISFSLTLGEDHVEMPEVPLYMDYLLTQNNKFRFGDNSLHINGREVFVVSLVDILEPDTLYPLFVNVPYRHVRRLLCFGKDEMKAEMKRYAGSWCSARRSMKSYLMQDIVQELNGYYHEGLYFHLRPEQSDFPAFLSQRFDESGFFYRIETFNLKDCWWGSLPGNFLANVVPPSIGFRSLEDILCHPLDRSVAVKKKQFDEELIERLKGRHVSDGESSGATFETKEQLQKQKEALEYEG